MLLPVLGFLFVSLLVAAAALALSPGEAATIERRLGEVAGPRATPVAEHPTCDRVMDTLKRLGNAAPRSASEMGKLQRKLVNAGYRSNEAIAVFFDGKPRPLRVLRAAYVAFGVGHQSEDTPGRITNSSNIIY